MTTKRKKSVPLPCTEEQYKVVKMYCLVNNYKYADLTDLLINIIKGETKHGKPRNNTI